ncbi:MAG TPA: hypothetical protein VM123_08715 [archaeon]|nr:hypothetical protein [archaeon]
MSFLIKVALLVSSLILLVGLGCKDMIYSPFYNYPERRGPEYPQAGLEIVTEKAAGEDEACSLEVNQEDSVFVLEIQVGPVSPEKVRERNVVQIELEVTVGLRDGGLVLADTAGIIVNGPGNYPLVLKIENGSGLVEGENKVAIIAITRYLDYDGNLLIPMGRKMIYCTLNW